MNCLAKIGSQTKLVHNCETLNLHGNEPVVSRSTQAGSHASAINVMVSRAKTSPRRALRQVRGQFPILLDPAGHVTDQSRAPTPACPPGHQTGSPAQTNISPFFTALIGRQQHLCTGHEQPLVEQVGHPARACPLHGSVTRVCR